jgi:hypothetical protein
MTAATDVFDYVTVMVSVVVGLGLTRLLAAIGDYVPIRRRVKTYWVHSCWILALLLMTLNIWWVFWELRSITVWTSREFVWIVLGPSAFVIACHLAVPDLSTEPLDLERYYYDTNEVFFGLLAFTVAWGTVTEPLLGLSPFFVGFRPLQMGVVALLIACALSKDRRLHAVVTIILLAVQSGLMFLVRHRADDLLPQ